MDVSDSTFLFSFLITVFNREATLQRCLESVSSVDHLLCEIIIVDDGSTDEGSSIAIEFCHQYPNCVYHYQDNSGSGPAFQKALDLARGEYVVPLDSDDWVAPTFFRRAKSLITSFHPDVIQLEFQGVYADGRLLPQCHIEQDVVVTDKNHPVVAGHLHHLLSTWRSKVLKRSIARRLRVVGTGRGGDNLFIAQFLFLSNTIGFLAGVSYYCGINEDSDSRKTVGLLYWHDYLSRWLSVFPWFVGQGLTRKPTFELANFFFAYRDYALNAFAERKMDKRLISSAQRALKSNRSYIVWEKRWSLGRLKNSLFIAFPKLACCLARRK